LTRSSERQHTRSSTKTISPLWPSQATSAGDRASCSTDPAPVRTKQRACWDASRRQHNGVACNNKDERERERGTGQDRGRWRSQSWDKRG